MKKVLTIFLSVMLLASLAACQSAAPAASPSASAQASESESATPSPTPSPSESEEVEESEQTDSAPITVISREDGSGTRGAFTELFGVLNEDKEDMTTDLAEITNSTSVMMTSVAGNPDAIGYISLGSLNDTVKAAKIDGVDATVDNINNGTYAISRPFVLAVQAEINELAQDFLDYIMSTEGQDVIEENGYIRVADTGAYAGAMPGGSIIVAGSSSVSPVMEKLIEAYTAMNTGAEIELQTSDSSTGMNNTIDGVCDIGMASRELKDTELEVLSDLTIAMDGIAVIVNNDNPVSDLSKDQVKAMFTADITEWSELDTIVSAPVADANNTEAIDAPITVISREDGSGTRGAFTELFGVLNEDKEDMTTDLAEITNSTSVMMTSVAGNPDAIGYISLGSLNDTVKAAKIDGVDATVDNINNGTYAISRPFVLAVQAEINELAQDFLDYIMSTEGQDVIEENGYIRVADTGAYAGAMPGGSIIVAGSSSVSPVMEKLIEAYTAMNTGAEIELQTSDSSTGMNNTIDGVCDIGMASRELKDTELEVLSDLTIAMDGIAVIVNNDNPVSDLTKDQVKQMFTAEITNWSELN